MQAYLRDWAAKIQRGLDAVDKVDKSDTPITETMVCLATEPWEGERYSLRRMTVTPEAEVFQRLRAGINGNTRFVPAGEYWNLSLGGAPMMTDTPDEKRDHIAPVVQAQARAQLHPINVLINGLGLGCIANAMLAIPNVAHVTVVEHDADVVKHMAPAIIDLWGASRVTVETADAFTYQPPKGRRYGVVWHDIWQTINPDNLTEMHRLHRKYGRRASWQGSWSRTDCERIRRREKSNGYW
jgi:hypothetical protein